MTIWEAAKRESQRGFSFIDALAGLLSSGKYVSWEAEGLIAARQRLRDRAALEAKRAAQVVISPAALSKAADSLMRGPRESLAPATARQRRNARIKGLLP